MNDMNSTESAKPVITRTALRAYPGWEIVHNATDATFWANDTRGVGIGPGEATFTDALFFVKNGRPPVGDELGRLR